MKLGNMRTEMPEGGQIPPDEIKDDPMQRPLPGSVPRLDQYGGGRAILGRGECVDLFLDDDTALSLFRPDDENIQLDISVWGKNQWNVETITLAVCRFKEKYHGKGE